MGILILICNNFAKILHTIFIILIGSYYDTLISYFTALNKSRILPEKIVPSSRLRKEFPQVWQENQAMKTVQRKNLAMFGKKFTVMRTMQRKNLQ